MEPRAGVSKQDIREQIWGYMESQNLADFPRPVHHRIPNFKGASHAAEQLPRLQAFKTARTIKVNPDAPQKSARFFVLESKKTLLVPTPRLRTGLFNKITPPPGATKDILRKCATSQGVRNYSVPIGLDSRVLVDLVVVGSVAVSEKGWRIGKGEGYADLEYAMMVSMGAVSKETPVVTIVHDCQVVDIPEELVEEHDITVDYILTPTRVIATGCKRPKPMGITWFKISLEMMEKIPILRSLRAREQQAGKDVTLQGEHQHLPEPGCQQTVPLSVGRRPPDTPGPETNSMEAAPGSPPGEGAPLAADVYVGNLPGDARVSDLKRALRELGSVPLRLTWQGPRRRAFLHYPDSAAAQQAVSCLQGLRLGTDTLRVALARQQRDK
ncbi:methenyltetrahydrofolate synthase domain-containing protein isoform 4 [Homo sapiens]|uniref:Isoform 4 of Methenyltetrahydrofolate synthase domain-containing protein n=1 Tax=Homo sapiens TaxID=9606 RepID=Q2M296-4|nr:methenyltetrahydrofolate synthase domain-containing protein isoform 4 [Homo sapiens]|eukprot:NP_001152851.1 methenyltetrahydrofolate synthase domain-containing protein isoform 4 [Homo sapiens]